MNTTAPADVHIPGLRNLWKAAFGDTDDFLDDFFATAYAPHRCRCIVVEDRVAAALYWLDCTCQEKKLAYVYAVATDPAYRGRGLCRTLMAETMGVLKNSGYSGVVLVPQKPGLVNMYAGMGFTPSSGVTEFHVMAGVACSAVFSSLASNESKFAFLTRAEASERSLALSAAVSSDLS